MFCFVFFLNQQNIYKCCSGVVFCMKMYEIRQGQHFEMKLVLLFSVYYSKESPQNTGICAFCVFLGHVTKLLFSILITSRKRKAGEREKKGERLMRETEAVYHLLLCNVTGTNLFNESKL